jgi:hypothetical protein
MIPVLGLEQVQVAWVIIEKEGYRLYGFLLYTSSDRAIVDYMRDGIFDLDFLSGDECAVFAIESPSKEWLEYTKKRSHSWWRLFGKKLAERYSSDQLSSVQKKMSLLEKNIIENNHNCTIVIGSDNTVSLMQILDPPINLLYDRIEALKVAKYFGLSGRDVPCLIFFKDLGSQIIWKSSLGTLKTQDELKGHFRDFFESHEFKSLLA